MTEKQRILKLTDQENVILTEVLNYIRRIRGYEENKNHKSMIGRLNLKVYNDLLEMETINFKTTTFKSRFSQTNQR